MYGFAPRGPERALADLPGCCLDTVWSPSRCSGLAAEAGAAATPRTASVAVVSVNPPVRLIPPYPLVVRQLLGES